MKSSVDAWKPEPADELLLDIAMGTAANPRDCFAKWRAQTSWEQAPGRIYGLLPSIYYSLPAAELPEIDRQRLAGVARKVALQSEMMANDWAKLSRQITAAGIKCWVRGELLLALILPEQARLKPLHNLEIAVTRDNYPASQDILTREGWNHNRRDQFTHAQLPVTLCLTIRDHNDNLGTLLSGPWMETDPDGSNSLARLDGHFEDILAALCLKGMVGRTEPQLAWIVDIHWLLQAYDQKIEWPTVAERFITSGLPWHGLQTLTYLSTARQLPIPALVLARLRQVPVSRTEFLLYRYGSSRHRLARLVFHWQLASLPGLNQSRVGYILSKLIRK